MAAKEAATLTKTKLTAIEAELVAKQTQGVEVYVKVLTQERLDIMKSLGMWNLTPVARLDELVEDLEQLYLRYSKLKLAASEGQRLSEQLARVRSRQERLQRRRSRYGRRLQKLQANPLHHVESFVQSPSSKYYVPLSQTAASPPKPRRVLAGLLLSPQSTALQRQTHKAKTFVPVSSLIRGS